MRLTLAESAVADLEDTLTHYRERGADDTGRRIVGELLADLDQIARHPDSGRIVPEFGAEHLRELIRPPFRIVYRRDAARVRIVRVWRSERTLELDD